MQRQRQIQNCVKNRSGEIVDGEILLTIFKKRSIFDVLQGPKYFSGSPSSSTSGVILAMNR